MSECSGCHTRWRNSDTIVHCGGCHAFFTSDEAFDSHRYGKPNDRRCNSLMDRPRGNYELVWEPDGWLRLQRKGVGRGTWARTATLPIYP